MQFINSIKRLFNLYRLRAKIRRENQIKQRAKDIIQAREFNGRLYVAFNSQPLIDMTDTPYLLPAELDKARRVWSEYIISRPKSERQ